MSRMKVRANQAILRKVEMRLTWAGPKCGGRHKACCERSRWEIVQPTHTFVSRARVHYVIGEMGLLAVRCQPDATPMSSGATTMLEA